MKIINIYSNLEWCSASDNTKKYFENKSPDNYEELKKTIDNIIKVKISKTHLENYFNYLFLQATDFINKNK